MEPKERKRPPRKGEGRPKSPFDLPDTWKATIIKMYSQGASDAEIKAYIYRNRTQGKGFSNDLWDRWLSEIPEFTEAIKDGRQLAQAWWEAQGRLNLKGKSFNHGLWYMNMKNRYLWQDNQRIRHEGIPEQRVVFDITLPKDED